MASGWEESDLVFRVSPLGIKEFELVSISISIDLIRVPLSNIDSKEERERQRERERSGSEYRDELTTTLTLIS